MKITGSSTNVEVAYEVWRERPNPEVEDLKVAGHMSARASLAYLRECRRHGAGFEFYRVKATTRRERMEER